MDKEVFAIIGKLKDVSNILNVLAEFEWEYPYLVGHFKDKVLNLNTTKEAKTDGKQRKRTRSKTSATRN